MASDSSKTSANDSWTLTRKRDTNMKQEVAIKSLNEAFQALQAMEDAKGKNAKVKVLSDHADNDVLRDLCFAAYGGDKYNTYTTVQWDDAKTCVPCDQSAVDRYQHFFKLLIGLRDRTAVMGDMAVASIDALMHDCSATEKKWYRRVMEHDLKVGMNTSFGKQWDFKTLTLGGGPKVSSGVQFPGVMLCEAKEKLTEKFLGSFLVEPKLDGLRLTFVWDGADWSFFSRQGKSERYNANLGHIAADIITGFKTHGYESGILDGEIMGDTWNSTLAIKRKEVTPEDLAEIQRCKFYAFDHLTGTSDRRRQLERRLTLMAVCGNAKLANPDTKLTLIDQHPVDTMVEVRSLFTKFLTQGYEGAIVKDTETVYEFKNKRCKTWVKLKPIDTQDVRVTGSYPGRERTRHEHTLGGFNVVDQAGQEFNVGGGFTDEQRDDFWKKRDSYVGKYLEIEFQSDPQQVAKGRFPVFVRWREDLE